MATTLTTLVSALADLRRRVDDAPSYRWGTVTGTDPLRVRLDGDSEPLGATPTALVAPSVGARVLVLLMGRRAVVLGGTAATSTALPSGMTTQPATALRTDLGGMLVAWDGAEWVRVGGGTLATSMSTSLSETTMTGAAGPTGMVALTFSLPVRATVRLYGGVHVVPSGNAAGPVGIYRSNVSGTRHAVANWHSRQSASQQFPRVETTLALSAGSHGFVLGVGTLTGSSQTRFYYPTLAASYA